ncbi:putative PH domain-containing protein [Neolecta irregularis DAH-3]|uniref:Putative PH domain-containing protein n=1 Tax=Neolecta irregularis (strain DAH-3) TaxID=1198029 RepID=A0A1U7LTM3_NEOID|nr:putative PH domain-containing protein [Neolecta irregularis DAH-3]|eukprot:OLL25979.1 putative PH domain-containing protein [Neolecta irregularis DAH-3]
MTHLSPLPSTVSDTNEAGEVLYEDILPGEKIVHVGWLHKKTRKMQWKRRWFVLRPHQLAYYKDEKEYKVLRVIPTTEMTATARIKGKRDNVFGLFTRNRTFYFSADSSADTDSWVDNIRKTAELTDHLEETQLSAPVIDVSHYADGPPSDIISGSERGYLSGSENKSSAGSHPRFGGIRSTFNSDKTTESKEDKVIMQGHLEIQSRYKMKKRWIVLRGKSLAFYPDSEEYKVKKIIPTAEIAEVVEIDGVAKHKDNCFQIITDRKIYRMAASSEETLNRWLAAFAIARQKAMIS